MKKLVLLLQYHNTQTPEAVGFIRRMQSEGISPAIIDRLPNEIDADTLYLCDDASLIRALELRSATVVGCELSSPLPCQNIVTDIWSLDAEYLKERYDFINEKPHCYYTTDDFSFWSPDYATYAELFRLHAQEAYYLPDNLKTYTEEQLRNHFSALRLHSQLDEFLRPYCIREKNTGRLIGNIALSESNNTFAEQYNIDYYILPEFRGNGYAAKAIRGFLEQIGLSTHISVIAAVHMNNAASHHALAKLRKDGFSLPTSTKGELVIYALDELLSN